MLPMLLLQGRMSLLRRYALLQAVTLFSGRFYGCPGLVITPPRIIPQQRLQQQSPFSRNTYRRTMGTATTSRTTSRLYSPLLRRRQAYHQALPFSTTTTFLQNNNNDDDNTVPSDSCPLVFAKGPYNAAEVRVTDNKNNRYNDEAFLQALRPSLAYWTAHDYNSAWIHVPSHRASLVEALTDTHDAAKAGNDDNNNNNNNGFDFALHHVNTTERTIVLQKWLRTDTANKIPPYCTHQVGCAGFVLNDQNEMLLIQEWRGPPSNRQPSGQWKLPGGLLDAGESLEQATCREVWEETGIACEFESVLTFWHRHGLHFGKSDLYFVSLLKPQKGAASLEITPCPEEISEARWMSVDEFFATQQDHPLIRHVLKHNFQIYDDDNDSDDCFGNSCFPVGNTTRIQPQAEMIPGGVQWPNRAPYPTYSSVVRRKQH